MCRLFKMSIGFLFLLALIGCRNENNPAKKADGVLTPVKQNERNSQIISSLGFDTLLMYDLNIKNEDIKMIHVWVEHFKNGEKQEDIVRGATATNEDMTLSAAKMNFNMDDTTYAQWTLSMTDGTGSTTLQSPVMEVDTSIGTAQSQLNDKIHIEAEKPQALALIVKNGSKGIRVGLDEDVIENTVKENDEVYVVRVMISKTEEYE
ncbi:hypothetical protein [Fredinandcohnia sp. FSL W7-1320]|uniref:hypothetical protein n=1 Tax=Fredinandcohnia sp. FSL W7-1320 TaxID=2954540 RepID=UPI0030FD4A3C